MRAFARPLARLSAARRATPLLYVELADERAAKPPRPGWVRAKCTRLVAGALRNSIGAVLRRSDVVAAGPAARWFAILLVARAVPHSRRRELSDADLSMVANRLRCVVQRALVQGQSDGSLPPRLGLRIGWTVIEPVQRRRVVEELRQAIRGAAVVAHIEERRATALASITHELRRPLTSILGFGEMLTGEVVAARKRRRFARIIAREARRLQLLVDGLIDLGAWSAGKLDLRSQRLSLRAVAGAARESIEPLARGRKVRCTISGDAVISGDLERLQQILINVLDNAVRQTPAGGRVRVALRSTRGDRSVTITDGGRGYDEKTMRATGVPFAAGEDGHTGLGLAIVRLLVEAHGGAIYADNPVTGGGRFRIVFPAGRAGAAAHIPGLGAGANKRL